jgi:hypothetical protein
MKANVFLATNPTINMLMNKVGLTGMVGLVIIGFGIWHMISNARGSYDPKTMVPRFLMLCVLGASVWRIDITLVIGSTLIDLFLSLLNQVNGSV